MNRKRKAKKEAEDNANKHHHELGPWRDTTPERGYAYCSKCGGVLTICVDRKEKFAPTMQWNNGVDVAEYVCPVGKTMSDKVKKLKEETMPYEPT